MKFGYRTPNLTKSLKARTTGKLKRELKSSLNPYYGKKGTGSITHPKKSLYNKVYHQTTASIFDKATGVSQQHLDSIEYLDETYASYKGYKKPDADAEYVVLLLDSVSHLLNDDLTVFANIDAFFIDWLPKFIEDISKLLSIKRVPKLAPEELSRYKAVKKSMAETNIIVSAIGKMISAQVKNVQLVYDSVTISDKEKLTFINETVSKLQLYSSIIPDNLLIEFNKVLEPMDL